MAGRRGNHLLIVDQVADVVLRRGWSTMALFLLDIGRPLALLGGQFLWILQPSMSFLFGRRNLTNLARLLEQPKAMDALVEVLEQRQKEEGAL